MSAPSEAAGAAAAPLSRRRHRRQPGVQLALGILVFLGLFPFLIMLTTSVKNNAQYFRSFWRPSLPFHWDNYSQAWDQVEPYLITSLVVAAGAIMATLALSTVAAFIFARYDFLGRQFLFGLVAALLMVPGIASLIPLFILMKDLGLLNTRIVLVIPHVAAGSVLGTILMKTFVEQIPQELFDSARMDGASGFRMFTSVMLPLSLPVIGTVALVTVIGVWNDFFWPLLTISDNNLRTVSAGLQFFQTQNATEYGPLFAGYLLASLPLLLLFAFLSKYFLAGLQGGLPGSGK